MSPRALANISPESNCSAVSVLVVFLHSFIGWTLFLRGWWNPSGQLASYSSICAWSRSIASCTFTSSGHIRPETMFTRADAWPAVFKGSMQSFSFSLITCLSFTSYLIRDANSSLWEVISTDEESFKSTLSFITHKHCLYELVCPYTFHSPCLWCWTCSPFRNLSRGFPHVAYALIWGRLGHIWHSECAL